MSWKDRAEVFVAGDHVAYNSWIVGNFTHSLIDHLPVIAWLKENLPETTKFILPKDQTMMAIMDSVGPDFVRNRVVWVGQEVVTVQNGRLDVLVSPIPARSSVLVDSLVRWLMNTMKTERSNDDYRTVLCYTRGGSKDTHHGRVVDQKHEADIIQLIRSKMDQQGLSLDHRLIIYNGQENGTTMSVKNQQRLFSTVTTAIGPHGSGLANVLWMLPKRNGEFRSMTNHSCDPFGNGIRFLRSQVLEFLISPDSGQVQPMSTGFGTDFRKTYYDLYAQSSFLEYWHVLYAANSTGSVTFINLDAFALALDKMWEGRFS